MTDRIPLVVAEGRRVRLPDGDLLAEGVEHLLEPTPFILRRMRSGDLVAPTPFLLRRAPSGDLAPPPAKRTASKKD